MLTWPNLSLQEVSSIKAMLLIKFKIFASRTKIYVLLKGSTTFENESPRKVIINQTRENSKISFGELLSYARERKRSYQQIPVCVLLPGSSHTIILRSVKTISCRKNFNMAARRRQIRQRFQPIYSTFTGSFVLLWHFFIFSVFF